MLGRRRRGRTNIQPTLVQFLVFAGMVMKWVSECLNINICKCLVWNLRNASNFPPVEVVGRGSGPQIQVGENSNYIGITA